MLDNTSNTFGKYHLALLVEQKGNRLDSIYNHRVRIHWSAKQLKLVGLVGIGTCKKHPFNVRSIHISLKLAKIKLISFASAGHVVQQNQIVPPKNCPEV